MAMAGRLALCALVGWLTAGAGRAATVYDLDRDGRAALPGGIHAAASPIYVTTSGSVDAAASIDTLRLGQYSVLHLGYGPGATAGARVSLEAAGMVAVEGKVYLGKAETPGAEGLPEAASGRGTGLTAGGGLAVARGGWLQARGGDDAEQAVITARRADIAGGMVALDDYAILRTTDNAAPGTWGCQPSLRVRDGGMLIVNGGVPPAGGGWEFKGVDVTAGGAGVQVARGGTVMAGSAGGTLMGGADQTLRVGYGGLLDVSRGHLHADGFGSTIIGGGYRAGVSTFLTAAGGTIRISAGAALSLSRAFQRQVNRGGTTGQSDAVVLRGRDIRFDAGAPQALVTGMGTYALALETVDDPEGGGTWRQLRIASVDNAVRGDGSDGDRERFRRNMEGLWRPGRMDHGMADTIYRLTATEAPSVQVVDEGGRLNQAVLEALVDGHGQPFGQGGVATSGVFEMYSGAAGWGVTSVALNAGEQFMAGLGRRVDRIGAEMDRLGEGWGTGCAPLTCAPSLPGQNRVWLGAHGRNEDDGPGYGIAGYTYRPRGFMTGYDRSFGGASIGVAFAHGQGSYRDRAAEASDSKITSYSLGLYGSYHGQSGLTLSGFAAYSHLDNDLADMRGGLRRRADHASSAWSVGARAGYDLYLTDRIMLSPSAGLTKTRAQAKSHDEFLADVRVLRVGAMRRDSTLAPIDLTVGVDVIKTPDALLRLTGSAGYAYDFEDGGLDGGLTYHGLTGTSRVQAPGRSAGRNRYSLGAGIVYTGERLDLGARYDYFKRSEQTTHQAQGSVGLKF